MSIFKKTTEAEITRAMIDKYWARFSDYVESDVIVVGAGPAGLTAAYELAKNGVKTLVIERNNYLGGGMWLGGYGVPEMVIREPGNFILDELKVPYEIDEKGLVTVSAPLVASKIIAAALEKGAMIANLTLCEDIVVKEGRVRGVVINWASLKSLPRQITCVDPVALESEYVIATTGHEEASITKRLSQLGLIEDLKGMGAMNVELSEEEIVEYTKEIYPGVIVAGMEASTAFGLHRMGPTFGAMFVSGRKAAEIVLDRLEMKKKEQEFQEVTV